MTSIITKYISKRILGESLQNNFGKEDPYFETVPATRLDGRPSKKMKKRRKALPAGLSEHDGKVLTKVKRRAYRLDMSLFNCCGIRFGWSSLIGIIPVVGDAIDAFMALMVLRTCEQVEGGLPPDVKSRMYFNIVLDFALGLCPIVGDVADALFRANTRNAVVLESYLRKKGAKTLQAQGHPVPIMDPSDPDEFDRQEHSPPPQYSPVAPTRNISQAQGGEHFAQGKPGNENGQRQAPPQQAPLQYQNAGGGFFGFGRKKNMQPDPERGMDIDRRQNDSQNMTIR